MSDESPTNRALLDKIRALESDMALVETALTLRHMELCQAISLVEDLQLLELRLVSGQLDRNNRRICLKLSRLYTKINALEGVSYNGTLLWKLRNPVISGRVSIESPMLYTSRHGYALSARAYPAGYGEGAGSHMSLYFAIKRHDLDDLKQWPFQQRVTFRLINQTGGDHIVHTVTPDPARPEFQKPSTASNPAHIIPQFVLLEALRDPKRGFVVDDTLFIVITVDTTGLREPLADIQ